MKHIEFRVFIVILVTLLIQGCASKKEVNLLRRNVNSLQMEVLNLKEKNKQLENEIIMLTDKVKNIERFERKKEESKQQNKENSYPKLSPEEIYYKGLELYKKQQYNDAIKYFEEYLSNNPGTDLSDNAQFWIGECYYQLKEYDRALDSFKFVIENFPNGNKVPDSLYKIGKIYEIKKNYKKARAYFKKVVIKYPNSYVARYAKKYLKGGKK